MATINMTSCEFYGAISPPNQVLIFNRPAGWIRIGHPDFGGRLHDMCSLARREMLARRPNRISAAAAAAAKTPRRRTSGP